MSSNLVNSPACLSYPPPGYQRPAFPTLGWPPQRTEFALYSVYDAWRFTLLWTLIIYAIFHLGAAAVAIAVQLAGRRPPAWKYLWAIPAVYSFVAGLEATFAGSIVGLIVGAVYQGGCYEMPTWVPFIWGWINVLVLIVSSFTIQGGL